VAGLVLFMSLASGATAAGAPAGSGGGRAGPPAKISSPGRSSGIPVGRDQVVLLSQPAWAGPGPAEFQLRIQVTASDPSRESLEVIVYNHLTARSAFDAALVGDVYGVLYNPGPEPLDHLTVDPLGGFDVDLPVDYPNSGLPLTTTGIYPLQIFLDEGGVRMGQPLTTFLVYVDKYARDLQRLRVGIVLPLSAKVPFSPGGVPGRLSQQAAGLLETDVADLARWRVPVTVLPDVPALESLAGGDRAERGAIIDLRRALQAGDELLPGTALPVDVPAMVHSRLLEDLQAELALGASKLGKLLGVVPSRSVWVSTSDIDPITAGALVGLGTRQLVLPAGDLSGLPPAESRLTFARPTELTVPGGRAMVVGADAELSARMTTPGDSASAVLVASQVLAELAMVDLESPSNLRGVAIVPSSGPVSPQFLSVLLSGLTANPLLEPVSLARLFTDVPVATNGGANGKEPLVRSVAGPASGAGPLRGTGGLAQVRRWLSADAEVYGATSALVSGLSQQLGTSLSSIYDGARRASLIAAVSAAARGALAKLRLPSKASITLTSRTGKLPLTLASGASSDALAHVRLTLRSDQLSFVASRFAEGKCQPVNPGSEDCSLVLSQPIVTLQLPVVARASGTFPLFLVLSTPDGSEIIASDRVYVTSTAISDLGLALMIAAVLFLSVWWARNSRHGRRARRLVPKDQGSVASRPAARARRQEARKQAAS
jgi:hypothetical protein